MFYRELFTEGTNVLEVPQLCVGAHCLLAQPQRAAHDGITLTLLARVKPRNRPILTHVDRYQWWTLTDALETQQLRDLIAHGPIFEML